jgi:DNA polymerase I
MTKHLLIDADYLLHQAACAAQQNIDWGDGVSTSHASLEDAQHIFETSTWKIVRTAWEYSQDTYETHMCFSCPTRRYFRHDIDPEYKGHRRGGPGPILKDTLRMWAEQNYKCWTRPNLEADDVLGILATHPTLIKGEKIVVSVDKDLHQIPGLHIDPKKLHKGVYTISTEQADRQLFIQVIAGDSVDGYKGVPGMGIKRAERLYDSSPFYMSSIIGAYKKAGCSDEYLEQQYNLARILQHNDYNYRKKEPILWQLQKD